MHPGPVARKHTVCQDCGVEFLRWRKKSGNLTLARYCPKCSPKHGGFPPNTFLQINIIRARRNNPCATLEGIGRCFGITGERVRQILSKAGKPTRAYHQHYLCIQCGKSIGTLWHRKRFCSRQCQHDYGHIKIACIICGKLREYRICELIWNLKHGQHSTDKFFCSKQCQGRWLGREHGIPRKWDYSKVYELRSKTGWGARNLGHALGIPEATVSAILAKQTMQGG